MEKIRTVIVDDEPLARERVRTLLAREPDFDIVAECPDGANAIEAIESLQPDIVFLDVQMPEVDGFDVLMSVSPEKHPLVIFVTAYDRYAVKAFEVHALDYILKPFDKERFAAALLRARSQLAKYKKGDFRRQFARMIGDLQSKGKSPDRLLIKSGGRILFLQIEEIDWVEAAGNYVRIHAGTKDYLMRETMNVMVNRLSAFRFVRIHRSTVVNLDRIAEMQPIFNGDFVIILHDGQELKLSRNYRAAFEKRLGETLK